MKKLFFTLFASIFCSVNLFSQSNTIPNSFSIIGETDSQKSAYYSNCIANSSMETYRLLDKDVHLIFNEGFECVLISAKKLSLTNQEVDLSGYQYEFPSNYKIPVFNIHESGHIVANYNYIGKVSNNDKLIKVKK